jgi:hypothetical protein
VALQENFIIRVSELCLSFWQSNLRGHKVKKKTKKTFYGLYLHLYIFQLILVMDYIIDHFVPLNRTVDIDRTTYLVKWC